VGGPSQLMTGPMRLGLIGRGRWGRNIERTLLSFADVSVVMIGRQKARCGDLDGVLVASPSATHAELALPYIEAGVPTFIEKPMATSVADAQRIKEAADRTRAIVFVGHIHLYNPAFLAVLELLPKLGTVRYVLCESANGNARVDCSVLWDWLPHDLSMGRAIFRTEPVSVQAWSLTDSSVSQAAASRYRYGHASFVSLVSWLSPVGRRCMTITADKGVIIFDDRAQRKIVLYDETGAASFPNYDDELPLTQELRLFLEAVRSGCVDPSQIMLGISIAKAISAAEESLSCKGAVVKVPA
jgi:predicted dehydrogenase